MYNKEIDEPASHLALLLTASTMIVVPLLIILLIYVKGAEWATSVVRQFFPFTLGIITQQNWYFPYVAIFLLGMFLIYEYRKRSKKETEGRKKVWEMREAVKQNITTEPSLYTYDPEIPGVSLTAVQYKKETRTNSQEEKEYDDAFLQAFKQALIEGIRQGKIQVEISAEIPLPKDALTKGSKGMIRVTSANNTSQQQKENHTDDSSPRSPVEILKEAEGEEEA